jgi:hypothetical protein
MTALTPMQEFQERLKGQLRDDIARMLPEAAVKQMIEQVVKEEFFTKKSKPAHGGYGAPMVEVPSQFQGMVMEAAKPILQKLAAEWMDANTDKLVAHWKEILDDGVVAYVGKIQEEKTTGDLRRMLNAHFQELNNERSRNGQAWLPVPVF